MCKRFGYISDIMHINARRRVAGCEGDESPLRWVLLENAAYCAERVAKSTHDTKELNDGGTHSFNHLGALWRCSVSTTTPALIRAFGSNGGGGGGGTFGRHPQHLTPIPTGGGGTQLKRHTPTH